MEQGGRAVNQAPNVRRNGLVERGLVCDDLGSAVRNFLRFRFIAGVVVTEVQVLGQLNHRSRRIERLCNILQRLGDPWNRIRIELLSHSGLVKIHQIILSYYPAFFCVVDGPSAPAQPRQITRHSPGDFWPLRIRSSKCRFPQTPYRRNRPFRVRRSNA